LDLLLRWWHGIGFDHPRFHQSLAGCGDRLFLLRLLLLLLLLLRMVLRLAVLS
jgi:hypothetical protein